MARVDIAIIGSGPAGVSAAITAKLRGKSVLLFGSKELSDKIGKAHKIQNYPGLPDVTGEEMRAAFQRHLDAMELTVTEARVNAVYAMGDYFAVQTATDTVEATTVILATGVVQGKPLPGEEEFLGRGVSYCATCDAPLYRGKAVAVIGSSPAAEPEAAYMAEVAASVLYLPLYEGTPDLPAAVRVVREKPTAVTGEAQVTTLQTDGGTYPVDGVFLLRDAMAPTQLVPGLEGAGGHVAVNAKMQTNLPGCFACGDAVGLPYQYVKAAGEGNVAALSAVEYLAAQKRNTKE